MSETRFFDNPFADYSDADSVVDPRSQLLQTPVKENLLSAINRLIDYYEKNYDKSIDKNDYTVYTGTAGHSLLHLHLSHVFNDPKLLDRSLSLIESVIPNLKSKRYTFLCGDSGVLSIGSIVHHLRGNDNECNRLLSAIKSMVNPIVDIRSDLSDELLYGRSGYLFSLLYVRQLIPNANQIIDDNTIRKVVDTILKSGQRTGRQEEATNSCPLMYFWHQKAYIGAAHGLIGIMALLLEAKQFVTTEELNKLIRPTVDYILSIRFPSGNVPSSLGSDGDRLVHWCHGCPGAVHLFCLAFKTFNDERYLSAAKECCECIWNRGLLTKGYGLCHGTAGNGYAFLRLYQLTKDPKMIYRSVKFAEWCAQYGQHGCRTPDRPFSLFEGMAGTVYYMTDLLEPNNTRFPAFQLS